MTADSVAARAMTALLGIVRQATSNEPRRSGRTVARLATNWLMGLANGDEDEVEFGVITPGDGGIAVFLHGGVTAVLGGERSEVLRGREAGFTVDRVVTPAPGVGAGLFVDEAGGWGEMLPARGVFALGEGTAPGAGAVLWFGGAEDPHAAAPGRGYGAQDVAEHSRFEGPDVAGRPRGFGGRTGFEGQRASESFSAFEGQHAAEPQAYESLRASESQQAYESQHGSESRQAYGVPHPADSQQAFDSPDSAEPQRPFESPRSSESPGAYGSPYASEPHQGYDAQHAPDPHQPHEVRRAPESQQPYESPYASGPQRAYEPHAVAEPQWGPDLWQRDDSVDQATENYSTSPLSRDSDAPDLSGPTGAEPPRYPSVSTHLAGGPANAPRFPDPAMPPTEEPPSEDSGSMSGTPPQEDSSRSPRPRGAGSMRAAPSHSAVPHTHDPAEQANAQWPQDDSSSIGGSPQRSHGTGAESSNEDSAFGGAGPHSSGTDAESSSEEPALGGATPHSFGTDAAWPDQPLGSMPIAPSHTPESHDLANADRPTEASSRQRFQRAGTEWSDEDSSAISGTPQRSHGAGTEWQSSESPAAGAPRSSGANAGWPEAPSGPMRVTPPLVAMPSDNPATPANAERPGEDSAPAGGLQPRSYGAGSEQSIGESSPVRGTPQSSHSANAGWQSAESPALSSPQGAISPNLRKGGGAGEPEGVAYSGEQPEVAQHDQVPEVPVRNVDLEETMVPDETMVSRILEHIGVPESPGVVVKGFKCARDHLNDPRVSFCAVCGIRMDQLTCVLTDGVRPPLGLLLLDDGTSFVLDNDCVLGREPEHADAVARGARPVRLEDASGGMSRAHAEIRLIDWDVTVVDGGSTNGTHVRQPAHQDWTRAIPGHPVKLTPGAQVQLGGRVVTFDSQHGQL